MGSTVFNLFITMPLKIYIFFYLENIFTVDFKIMFCIRKIGYNLFRGHSQTVYSAIMGIYIQLFTSIWNVIDNYSIMLVPCGLVSCGC